MPATANDRKRHEALQAKIHELRARCADLQSEAAAVGVSNNGSVDMNSPSVQALVAAKAELKETEELSQRSVARLAGMIGSPQSESFLDDPGMVQTLEQLAHSSAPVGNLMLGSVIGQGELVDSIRSGRWADAGNGMMAAAGDPVGIGGPTDPSRVGLWRGIQPQLRRRLRLLDLINTQAMSGGSFYYTREQGSYLGAAEVAENATKPPGDVTFVDDEVVAQTIAAWYKVSRPSIADVPTLQGVLNQRLVYGVMRRVENQVLGGDGVGQNIRGILNTTGIAAAAFNAAVPLSDNLLSGVTDVLVSEAEPNAVVVNPVDRQKMLSALAAGSGERLDSDGAFGTPADTAWGLPLITSTVIPVGQALVGDFGQCTLFVREGVNVRVSDSDQNDFISNRLTLLGEGRFGLAIWNAAAFAQVHLA